MKAHPSQVFEFSVAEFTAHKRYTNVCLRLRENRDAVCTLAYGHVGAHAWETRCSDAFNCRLPDGHAGKHAVTS